MKPHVYMLASMKNFQNYKMYTVMAAVQRAVPEDTLSSFRIRCAAQPSQPRAGAQAPPPHALHTAALWSALKKTGRVLILKARKNQQVLHIGLAFGTAWVKMLTAHCH